MTILLLVACAVDTSDEPTAMEAGELDEWCADQPEVTWDTFGAGFTLQYCYRCHSAEHVAEENARFTLESAADVWEHDEDILRTVTVDYTMPNNGTDQVSDDDRALLKAWLLCAPPGT